MYCNLFTDFLKCFFADFLNDFLQSLIYYRLFEWRFADFQVEPKSDFVLVLG